MPQETTFILDRITEQVAHLQNHTTSQEFTVPPTWLPEGTQPGDALTATTEDATGLTSLRINPELTEELKARTTNLRASIPKAPTGDIEL